MKKINHALPASLCNGKKLNEPILYKPCTSKYYKKLCDIVRFHNYLLDTSGSWKKVMIVNNSKSLLFVLNKELLYNKKMLKKAEFLFYKERKENPSSYESEKLLMFRANRETLKAYKKDYKSQGPLNRKKENNEK